MMPMNGHFSGFHMKQTQVTTRKQKAPHSQQERNECGTDYRAFGTHRNNLIGTSIREQLEAKMKTSTRDHHPQLKNTNNLLRLSTNLPPASAVLISANPESSLHRQIPKAHVLVHLSWAPPLTKTSELHQRRALGLVGWLIRHEATKRATTD